MDPKKFLLPELQNLFEVSYFSESSSRIPTGQSSLEDNKEYPRLSSRVLIASPTSSEETIDNTIHDTASNDGSSSDGNRSITETPSTRMTEESDEDDRAVKVCTYYLS